VGDNARVASVLEEVADLLELKEDSFFQVRAYRRAAREISALTGDIRDLYVRGHLDQVPASCNISRTCKMSSRRACCRSCRSRT